MRHKAMEKLSETTKRKAIEENNEVKKKRRSAFDTLEYLKEKNEREKGLKEKEHQMRKEEKEVAILHPTGRYPEDYARRPTTTKGKPATTNDPATCYNATTARAKQSSYGCR